LRSNFLHDNQIPAPNSIKKRTELPD